MKKLKKFEDYTTVNLTDLENNWSPEYYNSKKEGRFPYVKKGGKLEKVDVKKSIPKDIIFMIPEDVEKYNLLADELLILKQKQDEILKKSYEMNKVSENKKTNENNNMTIDDYIDAIATRLIQKFDLTPDNVYEIIDYYMDDIQHAYSKNGGYVNVDDVIESWIVDKKLKWKK